MSTELNNVEKKEEAKLKAKYPNLKGAPGSSALLQKRMFRGPKYFDSGDYQMAKAKGANIKIAPVLIAPAPSAKLVKEVPNTEEFMQSTGKKIPTPESVSHRKPSLIQSNLVIKPTCE